MAGHTTGKRQRAPRRPEDIAQSVVLWVVQVLLFGYVAVQIAVASGIDPWAFIPMPDPRLLALAVALGVIGAAIAAVFRIPSSSADDAGSSGSIRMDDLTTPTSTRRNG